MGCTLQSHFTDERTVLRNLGTWWLTTPMVIISMKSDLNIGFSTLHPQESMAMPIFLTRNNLASISKPLSSRKQCSLFLWSLEKKLVAEVCMKRFLLCLCSNEDKCFLCTHSKHNSRAKPPLCHWRRQPLLLLRKQWLSSHPDRHLGFYSDLRRHMFVKLTK